MTTYKPCPRCGTYHIKRLTKDKAKCLKCGTEYYTYFTPKFRYSY